MPRLLSWVAGSLAVVALPVQSIAADWFADEPVLRGSTYYSEPKDWSGLGDVEDPLEFEVGLRYWYSWGSQSIGDDIGSFTSTDNAHIGELHLRIDDHSSRTYVKGLAGYSAAITGTYDSDGLGGNVADGQIGYAGADLGWNALGDSRNGLGGLVGYLYWNDSPRTSRVAFTTADSSADIGYDPDTGETFVPFDSTDNKLEMHALRLGVSGRAELGDMIDFTAELAAVPYAKVSGVLGAHGTGIATCPPLGNICSAKASETMLDGWGYGAMAEAFIGVTPVENLTFRLGGRAWYLQGTADATFTQATIGDPTDSDPLEPPNYDTPPAYSEQGFISTANPFSLLRYGLLAELTYAF